MTKKTLKISNTFLIFFFIVAVLAAFVFGTATGFSIAVKELAGCEIVSCADLEINATTCEICPETGLRILRTRKRIG